MKFINYLESISGISIYPMTSLILFAVFFSIVIVWAIRAKKDYIEKVKNLPLN